MAGTVMELSQRNLMRHDDRLAEIRDKRMIDPNSEKFYRIWSWIRDVNEQLANGGHLTTPQHSRPSTARQRGTPQKPTLTKNGRNNHHDPDHDVDGVEEVIAELHGTPRTSRQNVVPLALLNVTTVAPKPEQDHLAFIDDDIRAVDDDDEPPKASQTPRVNNYAHSINKQQYTWAKIANTNQSQPSARLYQQRSVGAQNQQQQQQQQGSASRSNVTPSATAFQNYPYGPTPSGKVILVKPAAGTPEMNSASSPGPVLAKNSGNISGRRINSSHDISANTSTPGSAVYQHTPSSRMATNHHPHQQSTTAPPAVGGRAHIYYHQQQAAPGDQRLRSALSRRTAPTVIPVPPQQHNLQSSQVVFKLQVSGEKLKPKAAMESRSQASLISTDPSSGTSKLSLPLMDRIKRITSKVKPLTKSLGASSNVVAPSSRQVSMDSLAQASSTGGDARTSPHVRFTGVPPLDDDDDNINTNDPIGAVQKSNNSSTTNSIVNSRQARAPPNQGPAKRFFQNTAQRIYRPFVGQNQPGRPQESPAPLQVTLV